MASRNQKVYLDHLIKRDNLLYRRQSTPDYEKDAVSGNEPYLKIEHLVEGDNSRAYLLRKPDFQRATWAWTPEDCVSLLQSVLDEQVVPSVIMWLSPGNLWYVLDGGHRISVLLAWIRDDWGDRLTDSEYKDKTLARNSKEAGERVRKLMGSKNIAPFTEYMNAHRLFKTFQMQQRDPQSEMSIEELNHAQLVRRWQSVNMGFPILWVKGDYEKAEESFLKINKTGRQLSPWETKLVEYRRSSFARSVMSVAYTANMDHCWPVNDPQIRNNNASVEQLKEVLQMIPQLHDLLFTPIYEKPIVSPQQPLLATPYTRPELKPAYLSELLTITEGHKGQSRETRDLLKKDAKDSVPVMVAHGHKILTNALDIITNIKGASPRSLNLAPLVYFYNNQGTYVRSLLYGMIYWLNAGSPANILDRKLIFSSHRAAFETVLLENKDRVIQRISRRIGSGSEVTHQTANYFNGLLKLLIKHQDQINSSQFTSDHDTLIETLSTDTNTHRDKSQSTSSSRNYTGNTRSGVYVKSFLEMLRICEICGGRFYPTDATQVDHIIRHRDGGPTNIDNGRETHPFCNNQRDKIEQIISGDLKIDLPQFDDPEQKSIEQQLDFLEFIDEPPEEEEEENI